MTTINTTVTVDRLAEVYIKIRAKRAEISSAYDIEDGKLLEKQKLVTQELLRICKETGIDSMRTKHGLISRIVKDTYTCSDYGPLKEYMIENNAIHLLQERIAQKNMADWIRDHPDDLPPAVNNSREYDVRIYKPRKEL